MYPCFICNESIEPDRDGTIRLEGVTGPEPSEAWVWGPVMVHYECRVQVRTPFDDEIMEGPYVAQAGALLVREQ